MKIPVMRAADGALLVAGYRIHAPGFTSAEQFDRAIQRAFDAGLQVEPANHAGRFRVINPASGSRYFADRRACSCKATRPCKHRAMVAFMLDAFPQAQALAAAGRVVAA